MLYKGTNCEVESYSSQYLMFSFVYEYTEVNKTSTLKIHHLFGRKNAKKEMVVEFLLEVVNWHSNKKLRINTNRNMKERGEVSDAEFYDDLLKIMKSDSQIILSKRKPSTPITELR